jgi:hypothetical protein
MRKESFADFNLESLVKLAEFYSDDFDPTQLVALRYQLSTYIDNIRADERFSDLSDIGDLAKSLVDTNKHVSFPLVYQLLLK